jgi:hypothetical protein
MRFVGIVAAVFIALYGAIGVLRDDLKVAARHLMMANSIVTNGGADSARYLRSGWRSTPLRRQLLICGREANRKTR